MHNRKYYQWVKDRYAGSERLQNMIAEQAAEELGVCTSFLVKQRHDLGLSEEREPRPKSDDPYPMSEYDKLTSNLLQRWSVA